MNGIFQITTTHKNNGEKKAPLVSGEHFYWNVGYGGWDNVTINGKPVADLIKSESVEDIRPESVIVIPNHAAILVKQSGYTKAVYWSMADSTRSVFDRHYFCFEPSEFAPSDFGKPETLIEPGHTRTSVVQISLLQDLRY